MTKIVCPKCLGEDISLVGNTHYICNDPNCVTNGLRTQFEVTVDGEIKFPYNQIFSTMSRQEFIRTPYIKLSSSDIE